MASTGISTLACLRLFPCLHTIPFCIVTRRMKDLYPQFSTFLFKSGSKGRSPIAFGYIYDAPKVADHSLIYLIASDDSLQALQHSFKYQRSPGQKSYPYTDGSFFHLSCRKMLVQLVSVYFSDKILMTYLQFIARSNKSHSLKWVFSSLVMYGNGEL